MGTESQRALRQYHAQAITAATHRKEREMMRPKKKPKHKRPRRRLPFTIMPGDKIELTVPCRDVVWLNISRLVKVIHTKRT